MKITIEQAKTSPTKLKMRMRIKYMKRYYAQYRKAEQKQSA
jgi:hypothetical protein